MYVLCLCVCVVFVCGMCMCMMCGVCGVHVCVVCMCVCGMCVYVPKGCGIDLPVIPALGSLRQGDYEFHSSLNYNDKTLSENPEQRAGERLRGSCTSMNIRGQISRTFIISRPWPHSHQ